MNKNIIPVIHCFDNNYVIPASVAFLSMLEHANPTYTYNLYVLHTDITEENQEKLNSIVRQFSNASLEFINMHNKFSDLFKETNSKCHYSKEVYYKLIISSLFPQYDYAIITDVDVLYQGDISIEFNKFTSDTTNYVAGVKIPETKESWINNYMKIYEKNFTTQEISKLLIGAGYMIYNLKKMRADNLDARMLDYLQKNIKRVVQLEQDVINLCCFPFIKLLPVSSMVCSYLYDSDLKSEQDKQSIQYPVQLHFATHIKPWNTPSCTKSHLWYEYLLKTPFFYEQMQRLNKPIKKEKWVLGKLPILSIKNLPTGEKSITLFHIFKLKRKKKKNEN